jgi:glutamine synthetase
LAAAVTIAAGLDGIERQLDPGEPQNVNLYDYSLEELRQKGIYTLPQSLHEALNALESDAVIKGALGELAEEFITLKRMEWVEYMRHVSEWEVQRYLEFF